MKLISIKLEYLSRSQLEICAPTNHPFYYDMLSHLSPSKASSGWRPIKTIELGVLTVFCFQGLEIVNPQAAETRVNEANAKYFSNTSGFLSVGKKTT